MWTQTQSFRTWDESSCTNEINDTNMMIIVCGEHCSISFQTIFHWTTEWKMARYIPRTQLTFIFFQGQPSKTRPFSFKTRVIWIIYIPDSTMGSNRATNLCGTAWASWATRKKNGLIYLYTFHYTGYLIGIPYNGLIWSPDNWVVQSPKKKPKLPGFFFIAHKSKLTHKAWVTKQPLSRNHVRSEKKKKTDTCCIATDGSRGSMTNKWGGQDQVQQSLGPSVLLMVQKSGDHQLIW